KKKKRTYSTRDSLVVTDPTTSLAISGLSMGERTGSRVFHYLWPYVHSHAQKQYYLALVCLLARLLEKGFRSSLRRPGRYRYAPMVCILGPRISI
ncbi:hypothetical protein B0T18DRAFT_323702, partial [Schizothecium vesticola]